MPTHGMGGKWRGLSCGPRPLVAKTCSTCGQLKMAKDFRLDTRNSKRRYWMAQCKRCQHLSAQQARKNANGEFWERTDTALRVHVPWSRDEIKRLRELLFWGLTYKEISEKMGRSVGSVNGAEKRYMVKGWRNVQQLQREAS